MKFIKGLIKTVQQMDRFNRGAFCGFSLMVLSVFLIIPIYFLKQFETLIPILFLVGVFILGRAFWGRRMEG